MENKSLNLEKVTSAVALLCVGVCFVVWADKVTDWICLALGIILLVYAGVGIFKYIKSKPEEHNEISLFGIILATSIGVLLVTRADFVKEAISFIIGIYIILSCSIQALGVSKLRHATGRVLGTYLWSIIGIVVGALCITGQFIIPNALATVTGVALIIYGISYLIGFSAFKKATKTASSKTIDHARIEEAVIVKEAEVKEEKTPAKTEKKPSKKSKK